MKNYVKLCNALEAEFNTNDSQRQKWQQQVEAAVGKTSYTLAITDNYDFITKELADEQVEAVELRTVTYVGTLDSELRFYDAQWQTVRELATGDVYALETDDVYDY